MKENNEQNVREVQSASSYEDMSICYDWDELHRW